MEPGTSLMADVVVIGGGPGGSAAATMVARQGLDVHLFEAARFPRDHVGESLLPASVPILEELGVVDAMEAAGFPYKWGATMVWGRDASPWSWYFAETSRKYPHSWQVYRATFDNLLLGAARDAGVHVHEEHRVTEVLFDGGRAVGVRYAAPGSGGAPASEQCTCTARVVIDASGQTALLGRALALREWDPAFRNAAVYAYFEGAAALPPPDETNILVESTANGWLWSIPLGGGLVSTGAVFDGAVSRPTLRRSELEEILSGEIRRAPHTSRLLSGAVMVKAPVALREWSYKSTRRVGDGWILVGDAACFVDPLFSSGVHLALSSGVLAAAYAVTALGDDEALTEAAARTYEQQYSLQYDRFRHMASLFYATNRVADSAFWHERRQVTLPTDGAERESFIRAVAGQTPLGYERSVVQRGVLPAALARSIADTEAGFARRRQEVDSLGAALATAVPVLAGDVTVTPAAVPEEGRFGWGEVLSAPTRPEGLPVSRAVAELTRAIDGTKTVEELAVGLARRGGTDLSRVRPVVDAAVRALYEEGLIATLAPREGP